jgi:tryptophanyl-tRNA synthetase
VIAKKIKRAVTDSGVVVEAAPDKPALRNLLTIYSLFSGESIPDIEQRFEGKGYGAFKSDLAEVVITALSPIQQRLTELNADPSIAISVLDEGAERAREVAERTMVRVRERMGLILS